MESHKPKLLVTGITGYLGSHVCNLFLSDNSYQVVGSVRSTTNVDKLKPLQVAYGDNYKKLQLVEMDLLNRESIIKAAEGCQYIVHTASPFPGVTPKDENVLIKPAVEGTLAVMEAARINKVKRVVITSSCAAVYQKEPGSTQIHFSEADWSIPEHCIAYEKSKTLAEKAAWDFIENLPEAEKFELVTINPCLILGPNLITGDFTSGMIIQKIMAGAYPGMPKIQFSIVDVREVAWAHVQGLKVKEAANKRFILSSEALWMQELAQILHDEYGKWYKFKTGELRYCTLRLASFFDASARTILPMWGKQCIFDNTRSREILKISYRSSKETLDAMVEALIEAKLIPEKRKK